jgi:glucose/arabinose dehydrogenase
MRTLRFHPVTPALVFLLLVTPNLYAQTPDESWTFSNNGNFDYTLTSVSDSELFLGTLPANDPAINLRVGSRYRVSVVNFGPHPFEVLAKGNSAGEDVVLLAMGGTVGSFEGDVGVEWDDDGAGNVTFTLTQPLVDAMHASNLMPGYRCRAHASTMRGDFIVLGTGTRIDDPIADPIPKGTISIELETIIDGLVSPIGLATPDDGSNRLFIYDQRGAITIVVNEDVFSTPFLDVGNRLVPARDNFDERGLLGLAFHPSFAENPRVYTYTSEPVEGAADFTTPLSTGEQFDHQSVIAEWTVDSGNPDAIDPSTRRELLRIDQPQFNHNGGTIRFGPDGFLYIALGDGGRADDQGSGHVAGGNGQDFTNVYGTILRIDVDANNAANGQYGIPPGNPFVGSDGVDEIYAYGFRNPFIFSFDSETGDLYVGDAGQNDIEEIDVVVAGGNHGWRLKEGSFFFDPAGAEEDGIVTTVPVEPIPPGLIEPIAEYDHDDGTAVIGGFVYRGLAIPGLRGRYVTGDFSRGFGAPDGRLFYLDEGGDLAELIIGLDDRPLGLWLKGFGQDRNGEIYVMGTTELAPTGTTGQVLRIVPVGATSARGTWELYN